MTCKMSPLLCYKNYMCYSSYQLSIYILTISEAKKVKYNVQKWEILILIYVSTTIIIKTYLNRILLVWVSEDKYFAQGMGCCPQR